MSESGQDYLPWLVTWNYNGEPITAIRETEKEADDAVAFARKHGLTDVSKRRLALTLEDFALLVERHDLTFDYSDDHRAWRSGLASFERIKRMMRDLGEDKKAQCVAIWNDLVRRKMKHEHCTPFEWRDA